MGAGGLPAERRLPVSYQDVAPDEGEGPPRRPGATISGGCHAPILSQGGPIGVKSQRPPTHSVTAAARSRRKDARVPSYLQAILHAGWGAKHANGRTNRRRAADTVLHGAGLTWLTLGTCLYLQLKRPLMTILSSRSKTRDQRTSIFSSLPSGATSTKSRWVPGYSES